MVNNYNSHVNTSSNIDKWSLAQIGRFADSLSNEHATHNKSNTGAIDKQVSTLVATILPSVNIFSFEVGPWISLLALVNKDSKKRGLGELIQTQKRIIDLINKNKSSFGYEGISNSLAFFNATNLIQDNDRIGQKTLSELSNSLNNIPDAKRALKSVSILNLILNEFAIVNQFNNVTNFSEITYYPKRPFDRHLLSSLTEASSFPVDLITEIENFIKQVYTEHPFSDTGLLYYLRSSIIQSFLNNYTDNVLLKKNIQTEVLDTEKCKKLHNEEKTITNREVLDIHNTFDTNHSNTATTFVELTFEDFNKICYKAYLVKKIDPSGTHIYANPASIKGFQTFNSDNRNLLKILDNPNLRNNKSNHNAEIKQLFINIDQYLVSLCLPNEKSTMSSSKESPLDLLKDMIQDYDKRHNSKSFDSSSFAKQLAITVDSGVDSIILYLQKYKKDFSDLLAIQDDSHQKENLDKTIEIFRGITKDLSANKDLSKEWDNIINNDNA